MSRERMKKTPGQSPIAPNMPSYDEARASFSWKQARWALDGLPGGAGLNIAHEAVDRHAAGPRAGRVALRCLGKDGSCLPETPLCPLRGAQICSNRPVFSWSSIRPTTFARTSTTAQRP